MSSEDQSKPYPWEHSSECHMPMQVVHECPTCGFNIEMANAYSQAKRELKRLCEEWRHRRSHEQSLP